VADANKQSDYKDPANGLGKAALSNLDVLKNKYPTPPVSVGALLVAEGGRPDGSMVIKDGVIDITLRNVGSDKCAKVTALTKAVFCFTSVQAIRSDALLANLENSLAVKLVPRGSVKTHTRFMVRVVAEPIPSARYNAYDGSVTVTTGYIADINRVGQVVDVSFLPPLRVNSAGDIVPSI
jgi:hypothetical protein